MHVGSDGACQSGWWPDKSDPPASVLASNLTAVDLAAAKAEEDGEIALNVVLGVLFIVAPTSALLASLAAVTKLFRGSAGRTGPFVIEEAAPRYEKLSGSPPECKEGGQGAAAATGAVTM